MSLDCYEYYLWTLGHVEVDENINEELLTTLLEVENEYEIL